MQERYAGDRVFIGLDPADPYAKRLRPWDYAVLDGSLACTFGQWTHNKDGDGIIPDNVDGRPVILAIDGPQGLAGEVFATRRDAERELNTPGRTPYNFPTIGRPYAGFITGSVELFHQLVMYENSFHLYGLRDKRASKGQLIEVFPGAAWRVLAQRRLPSKLDIAGQIARVELLQTLGVDLQANSLPTHDQLDAAIAAWTAYEFSRGNAVIHGSPPKVDSVVQVLREGFIVQPETL